MYITQKFTFGADFFGSARKAIREAYEQNGYPPNEVMVHPTTPIAEHSFVAVFLGSNEMHRIPLRVRSDLVYGFNLNQNEALLDVCNPNVNWNIKMCRVIV